MDVINKINDHLDGIQSIITNMPSGNSMSLSTENSPYIEVDNKETLLCNILSEITEWTEWSTKLVEEFSKFPMHLALLITEITGESFEYIVNNENITNWINDKLEKGISIKNKALKKLYRRCLIISAKVNKALKIAQRAAYKCMKNVLQKISGGKMPKEGLSFLSSILTAFNALTAILDSALKIINNLVKVLPPMIQLDAEKMGFFITPKSMRTITMIPTNDQMSIFYGISNELFLLINDFIAGIKLGIKSGNVAKIIATASTAASTENIPNMPSFNFDAVTSAKIMQKINLILSLFVQCEPLPEYNRLKLTNLGFQIWLNTSFELGMKQSFGIPGMP